MNAMLDKTQDSRASPRSRRKAWPGALLRRVGIHNISLLIALACLIAIFGACGRTCSSPRATSSISVRAITILGMLAMSQTVVIVAGGLDISVGAIVGLTTCRHRHGVQATGSAGARHPPGLVVGGLAGLVNGLIITYGRVNAVIATLGTMAIFRGVAFIMSDGQSITIFHPLFRFIGIGRFLGLPFPIWILIAVVAIFFVLMRYTIVGRNIYAIGGNPVVARFSGINDTRYRVGIYIMSGVAAGLGGHPACRAHRSGQPVSGSQAWSSRRSRRRCSAAARCRAARARSSAALLGVVIIGILNNGMILTTVPTFYQMSLAACC